MSVINFIVTYYVLVKDLFCLFQFLVSCYSLAVIGRGGRSDHGHPEVNPSYDLLCVVADDRGPSRTSVARAPACHTDGGRPDRRACGEVEHPDASQHGHARRRDGRVEHADAVHARDVALPDAQVGRGDAVPREDGQRRARYGRSGDPVELKDGPVRRTGSQPLRAAHGDDREAPRPCLHAAHVAYDQNVDRARLWPVVDVVIVLGPVCDVDIIAPHGGRAAPPALPRSAAGAGASEDDCISCAAPRCAPCAAPAQLLRSLLASPAA
jgi:hypothetical protein